MMGKHSDGKPEPKVKPIHVKSKDVPGFEASLRNRPHGKHRAEDRPADGKK